MCVVLTQQKNGVSAACWRLMKSPAADDELVVARLHPLARQRSGVLDRLLADPPPTRLLGRVILLRRAAAQHAARAEPLLEVGETEVAG